MEFIIVILLFVVIGIIVIAVRSKQKESKPYETK